MPSPTDNRRRAYWLKTLHQWHWISSAVCLIGLLLFSLTGITLNHSAQIEARARVQTLEGRLPEELREALAAQAAKLSDKAQAPVPQALARWLAEQLEVQAQGRDAEWSRDELFVSMPRPGGDAWVRIDLASGAAEVERTDRGWIAYLNDLHKGRHAGAAWSWFIDVFAVACLVFSITGLFILKLHSAMRPTTWPIVAAGLVIPLLLAILFIH